MVLVLGDLLYLKFVVIDDPFQPWAPGTKGHGSLLQRHYMVIMFIQDLVDKNGLEIGQTLLDVCSLKHLQTLLHRQVVGSTSMLQTVKAAPLLILLSEAPHKLVNDYLIVGLHGVMSMLQSGEVGVEEELDPGSA